MSKRVPIYWGLFLNEQFDGRLDKVIKNQHVTFGFKTDCPYELIGREYDITILGYGINDDNEAFIVDIPQELMVYYDGVLSKHVTLSVSISGKPVNSSKLEYQRLDQPIIKRCTMGYFDGDEIIKEQWYKFYHNDFYTLAKFEPVSNRPFFPKPYGGLWASPIFSDYGWKEWCKCNEFYGKGFGVCNMFRLKPDARVLRIESDDDLDTIEKNCDILQRVDSHFSDRVICMDFEKLLKLGYDAVEVWMNTARIYFGLYGWDCDSIIILNPDCIIH